ncbi:MAG: TetR/AcrR family transcriptional regulator [Micrococcales bacterium]|nr:TetR/AcrR family transcriptional regulator [Micrococcales bacterium]
MSADAASDPAVIGARVRRRPYHHGDLRRALLDAGLELATEGGPDSVVLRETTRRVGVSANAAYRHFADRDALLAEIVSLAQGKMADAIFDAIDAVPDQGDPGATARARFRAVGIGYVRFALTEPGLFRTGFTVPTDLRRAFAPQSAGECGRTPYQLLSDRLDDLLAVGVLPVGERNGAEFLAWSAVHGLAMLALDGPLRALPRESLDELTPRLVTMVDVGLGVRDPSST